MSTVSSAGDKHARLHLLSAVFITVLIQVLTIVVFSRAVGTAALGDWMVLSAIPFLLGSFDFGLTRSVSVEMTRLSAQGRVRASQALLCKAARGLLFFGSAVLSIIVLSIMLVDVGQLLSIGSARTGAAGGIIVALSAYSFLVLLCSLAEGAFRAGDYFARGIAWLNGARLVELGPLLIAVVVFRNLLTAALVLALSRLALTVAMYVDLSKVVPSQSLSWTTPGAEVSLRPLLGPSLASFGMLLGSLLPAQAVTILVGVRIGPEAVVTFNAVRVAANLIARVCAVPTLAAFPAVGRAHAVADYEAVKAIAALCLRRSFTYALGGAAALAVASPWMYSAWIGGEHVANLGFVALVYLGVLIDVPWQTYTAVLWAVNRHATASLAYVASAVLSLPIVWVLLPDEGLTIVPLAFLLVDLAVTPVAYLRFRRLIHRRDPAGSSTSRFSGTAAISGPADEHAARTTGQA